MLFWLCAHHHVVGGVVGGVVGVGARLTDNSHVAYIVVAAVG